MKFLHLSRHVFIPKLPRNVLKNFRFYCSGVTEQNIRVNHANIQMLSKDLHHQIFKDCGTENFTDQSLSKVKDHLKQHGLWDKQPTKTSPLQFQLPELYGDNIEEHFEHISKEASQSYFALAEGMSSTIHNIPEMPSKWLFHQGWTKYSSNGEVTSVECPEEDVLVFDVEVCVKAGNVPIMATAVSKKAW